MGEDLVDRSFIPPGRGVDLLGVSVESFISEVSFWLLDESQWLYEKKDCGTLVELFYITMPPVLRQALAHRTEMVRTAA